MFVCTAVTCMVQGLLNVMDNYSALFSVILGSSPVYKDILEIFMKCPYDFN